MKEEFPETSRWALHALWQCSGAYSCVWKKASLQWLFAGPQTPWEWMTFPSLIKWTIRPISLRKRLYPKSHDDWLENWFLNLCWTNSPIPWPRRPGKRKWERAMKGWSWMSMFRMITNDPNLGKLTMRISEGILNESIWTSEFPLSRIGPNPRTSVPIAHSWKSQLLLSSRAMRNHKNL